MLRALGAQLKKLHHLEPALYALVAGFWVLYVARWFYGSMRWQLYQSIAWAQGASYDPAHRANLFGLWSAPLDDVFIHFDFARSTARGFPFQWIDGNGYSSGGTSLLYPLILALGMVFGFQGLTIMHFAAVLAAVGTFATLLGLRRAFSELPRAASYTLPFALLGVGALSWSIFSGMELALFLAVWTGAVLAQDDLIKQIKTEEPPGKAAFVRFAVWNAILVATRPEALITVGVLSLPVAWHLRNKRSMLRSLVAAALCGLPAACIVLAQAIANRILTGDFAAAGAIVKLEMNSPHLTPSAVVDAYLGFLKYQVLRVTETHFSNVAHVGWLIWLLAAVALLPKSTRGWAGLLWGSLLTWIATVALNGQVRWQNERYTMPAVAFLMMASALGAGFLLTLPLKLGFKSSKAWAATAACVASIAAIAYAQAQPMAGQIWFFGRASRNIFDQQMQVGHRLGHLLNPAPHRIAMGDAGAIPFAADAPGLDLIGLGGTFNLPFARAGSWGLGATVELIQRLPKEERPDVFAIFPSWWGDLPLWFGRNIIEGASATARGNVICGGLTTVVYRTDFSALDNAETPVSLLPHERVVAALDFADIVSERAHHYKISKPYYSYVGMKMLPDPRDRNRDLWDASRIVDAGLTQSFTLKNLKAHRNLKLVFRVAPPNPQGLEVSIQGRVVGTLDLQPSDVWVERTLAVDPDRVTPELPIILKSTGAAAAEVFHLWAVQADD